MRFAPLTLAIALLVACEAPVTDEPPAEEPVGPDDSYSRYVREFVFVGIAEDRPLLVPFSFVAVDRGNAVSRVARGWVSHGDVWETFMQERWDAGPSGAVWRLLPIGGLRIMVGGPAEIEALSYRRDGDELRLVLEETRTSWERVGSSRFRLLGGTLRHRDQEVSGVIVETQQLRPASADRLEPPPLIDWTYLTNPAGDRQFLLVTPSRTEDGRERTLAWAREEGTRQTSDWLLVSWAEALTVDAARREIPVRWRYEAPELYLLAELREVGHTLEVGEERRGRRGVEARYAVEGTVTTPEGETEVFGIARFDRE